MIEQGSPAFQNVARKFVGENVMANQNFILEMAQKFYGDTVPDYVPFDGEDIETAFDKLRYFNVELIDENGKKSWEEIPYSDIKKSIEEAQEKVDEFEEQFGDKLESLEQSIDALDEALKELDGQDGLSKQDSAKKAELEATKQVQEAEKTNLEEKKERLEDNLSTLEMSERRDDYEQHEPYECWLVTEYFGRLLEERGEVLLSTRACTWWLRCTTGQAIYIDGVVEAIVAEHCQDELKAAEAET